MIRNWRFDAGEPHFMSVIDQWSEARDPGWHCIMYARECNINAVQDWFEENISEPSECIFRLNSGNLALYISIYNADDAALFKLTWG